MNIIDKIILIDTNIITDLDIAKVLETFVNLDNVYISDLIKADEINSKTGNLKLINKFKVIKSTNKQIYEMMNLTAIESSLTSHDIMNFVLAKDLKCILATGDKNLRMFSQKNNITVIGTLKILDLLLENKCINNKQTYTALQNLKNNPKTRLPIEEINKRIEKIEKHLVF